MFAQGGEHGGGGVGLWEEVHHGLADELLKWDLSLGVLIIGIDRLHENPSLLILHHILILGGDEHPTVFACRLPALPLTLEPIDVAVINELEIPLQLLHKVIGLLLGSILEVLHEVLGAGRRGLFAEFVDSVCSEHIIQIKWVMVRDRLTNKWVAVGNY